MPTPERDRPQAAAGARRSSRGRRIAWIAGAVLVVVVGTLEIASRAADAVVRARASNPAFDPKTHRPGIADKLAYATLDPEAQNLANARTLGHPYLGYALKAGWRTAPGAKQQASHNSLGFRGKETTYAKPPGRYRIVTLGGSSVYGSSESNDDAVWSARLERLLAEARPGFDVEVIDGGCPGYQSYEMLINLALRLLDFDPDLVVIYEAINDTRTILYTAGGTTRKNDNTQYRAVWPVRRISPIERALLHCRTYLIWRRYATDYIDEVADFGTYTMVGYGPLRTDLYCQGGDPEPGFVFYRRNLNHMISVAEQSGAKVLIATQAFIKRLLPPEAECRATQIETFDRLQAIQREVALERGVAYFDSGSIVVAEVERRFAADGHEMFKNDVHPFDDGSELIARTIADYLLKSDLLR